METFSRSTDSRVAPVAPERERTLGSTSLVEESRKVSSTVEPEERETLLATFARAMPQESALDLREAVSDDARGRLWKGILAHKSRDAPAHFTRMHVQPLWLTSERSKSPEVFVVYLDDVTEENKKHLRGMFS